MMLLPLRRARPVRLRAVARHCRADPRPAVHGCYAFSSQPARRNGESICSPSLDREMHPCSHLPAMRQGGAAASREAPEAWGSTATLA